MALESITYVLNMTIYKRDVVKIKPKDLQKYINLQAKQAFYNVKILLEKDLAKKINLLK